MNIHRKINRPSRHIGTIIGRLTNEYHTNIFMRFFDNYNIKSNSNILELGCGGGTLIQFLCDKDKTVKVWGLDPSLELLEFSKKINAEAISAGRVKLLHSNASKITLPNNSMDIISSLKSIRLWKNPDQVFSEVYRLLKPKGDFIMIERIRESHEDSWYYSSITTPEDYIRTLQRHGFSKIKANMNFRKGWVIITASKT